MRNDGTFGDHSWLIASIIIITDHIPFKSCRAKYYSKTLYEKRVEAKSEGGGHHVERKQPARIHVVHDQE